MGCLTRRGTGPIALFILVLQFTPLIRCAQAQSLFSVSVANNRINEINPNTGALINSYAPPVIAQTGGGVGLALSETTLYYSTIDNSNIYALNPATGAVFTSFARPAAATVGIDSLAYGPTSFGSTLFALDYTNNVLYLLNPANGATFSSYATSFDAIGGMDFNSVTGQLYISDQGGTIRALNPNTGAVLNSFSSGGFQTGIGLVGARLFTVPQTVATITERNPSTGAVLNSFAAPGGATGALAGPPIPEPSAMALAGAMLAVVMRAGRARR